MSVYFITSKTTLLSWRIISSDDPNTTFRALFRERLTPTICHECELEKVYVVSQVTAVFGLLIKYTVKTVQDSIKKCGIKTATLILSTISASPINFQNCTCSQILFQEKMNTTYHLKICMVLLLLKYTDHLHLNEGKKRCHL